MIAKDLFDIGLGKGHPRHDDYSALIIVVDLAPIPIVA